MMKLVIFAAVLTVAYGAFSGDARTAQIIRSDVDIAPDGAYQSSYETENGISGQETGALKNLGGTDPPAIVVQGSYQYQNPEGQIITIQYIADENGFQPQGDSIPK